jgi:hypothetical protein
MDVIARTTVESAMQLIYPAMFKLIREVFDAEHFSEY